MGEVGAYTYANEFTGRGAGFVTSQDVSGYGFYVQSTYALEHCRKGFVRLSAVRVDLPDAFATPVPGGKNHDYSGESVTVSGGGSKLFPVSKSLWFGVVCSLSAMPPVEESRSSSFVDLSLGSVTVKETLTVRNVLRGELAGIGALDLGNLALYAGGGLRLAQMNLIGKAKISGGTLSSPITDSTEASYHMDQWFLVGGAEYELGTGVDLIAELVLGDSLTGGVSVRYRQF